jgi:hypothetical protein
MSAAELTEADGPRAPTQIVKSMSGGGLTWTLAVRSNTTWGTTEVWRASAKSALSAVSVRATLTYSYDGAITVAAFSGSSGVGAVAGASGLSGAPTVTLQPSTCGSLVWAAGHDWSHAVTPVPVAGQSLVHSFVDTRSHDSYWTSKVNAPTTDRTPVKVKVTGPVNDRWTYAAEEIKGTTS